MPRTRSCRPATGCSRPLQPMTSPWKAVRSRFKKALVHLYKTEYVREWQKFMQGISVHDFASFDQAVVHMNRLGDPSNSPIGVLLHTLYEQTSWDNPSLVNERLAKGQKGFLEWFKQRILSVTPSPTPVNLNVTLGGDARIPMGPDRTGVREPASPDEAARQPGAFDPPLSGVAVEDSLALQPDEDAGGCRSSLASVHDADAGGQR
jgi:hypothetical protein